MNTIKDKKIPSRFSISFNERLPKHQEAVEILIELAKIRKVAPFLAEAIHFYKKFGESERILESVLMHGVKTPGREVVVTGPEFIHSPDSEPRNELETKNGFESGKSASHLAMQTPIGGQYKTFQSEKQEFLIQRITRLEKEAERLREEAERLREEIRFKRPEESPKDPQESLKPARTQEDTEEQNKYNSALREAVKVVKHGF